ncbi:CopG family ribbon-helix-helix protein [Rhizobium ruizarguesonis]|uniref:CopG family ribbon-helix-helix protein n=1 Tax=Rhizobium ruizarguesonis TaxID=2081791 RepID=UPI001FE21909|nr:ribbon-helix-helix domain-containing protein [Rhizobium ruizarguesonis]
MLNSEKSQVSLRLPTSLVSEFDRIAAILERDRTWVMQKALSQYLATEGAEILADAQCLPSCPQSARETALLKLRQSEMRGRRMLTLQSRCCPQTTMIKSTMRNTPDNRGYKGC